MVTNAPVSISSRIGWPRIEQGTVSAPVSSRCIGTRVNFSETAAEPRLIRLSLIDFKEHKFRAAINHRFVTKKNVEPEHTIRVTRTAAAAGMIRTTERDEPAAKIHGTSRDVLHKANRQ